MNVAFWLARAARLWPERPAILHGTQVVATYAEFESRVKANSVFLCQELGVGPGDRIAIFSKNRPEYLDLLYAAWWAGAVAVPVNAKLHPRELRWIVEDATAKAVFVGGDHDFEIDRELAAISAETRVVNLDRSRLPVAGNEEGDPGPVDRLDGDLAWLFYTSGTTGRPKGVMISHGNLQAMTLAYLAGVDTVGREDAILYAGPMSHGAGLYTLPNTLCGARHVVPESGGFDAAELLDLGARINRASVFLAPTMVRRPVDRAASEGSKGEGLRSIIYGGGPMYLADIERAVEVMGPRFIQIYGQGECPMTITVLARENVADRSHPRWRERLGSVGVAAACVDLRVTDSAGTALPCGEIGEIVVRGSPVMQGYWNNPAATADSLANNWLKTGDLGVLDADGFLTLVDRSKDVIISGGSNIYPREVEEVLLSHADVSEASVIGRPSAEWGEVVAAFIVRRPGSSLGMRELDQLCCAQIARFKRPKAYAFVDHLPKNNYGKVLKSELRTQLGLLETFTT